MIDIDRLLKSQPLVSDQVSTDETRVIVRELQRALTQAPSSAIVEFGCYNGTTSLFIEHVRRQLSPDSAFHVYDSFAGLPDKTAPDQSPAGSQFKAGELVASKGTFIRNFKQAGLTLPHIHKAWFANLTGGDIPDNIGFAFLDGDFYDSIWQSLQLIQNKLATRAIIVVDDYQAEALPGAAKAVEAWLRTQPRARLLRAEQSLAIISFAK